MKIPKWITRHIPLEVKLKLVLIKPYFTVFQANKRVIRGTTEQMVYLLDSPTHSNLGDHAIAYAQKRFIQKCLPGAKIMEIPIQYVDMHLGYMKKKIKKDDLICMIGGGNFGDEYLLHEYSKRKVCRLFPDNRVIVFPQTVYYSDTERGRTALAETQAALNGHRNLTIAARDKVSFERVKAYFPNAQALLVPDIVLSLDAIHMDAEREGVLCCLRKDLEKNAAFSAQDIFEMLSANGYAFTASDTTLGVGVPLEKREDELQAKWREFCSAQLVITDRLHGMIFACVTSTPCIVMDNYNHKVRDFYDTWLSGVEYIKFANSADEVGPLTRQLMEGSFAPWTSDRLSDRYQCLADALLGKETERFS